MEQDGAASAELQALLFSDAARKAPVEALVVPKSPELKNGTFRYRVYNGSGETIDSVRALCIPYGNDGKVISDKAISYEQNLLTKDWGITEEIRSNKSGMRMSTNSNFAGWESKMAKRMAVGIIAYHTQSGNNVVFAPNDVALYFSDGTVQYPEGDVEPYVFSDDEAAEINELRTGLTFKNLYPFAAEFYNTVEGLYVLDVAGKSLGERAGFKPGDIITAMDGKEALLVPTQHEAARKLLGGETVEYTYVRNDDVYTVNVSMDMEAVPNDDEREMTIADELLKYGDLLERGLITQEEFDKLKDKLING